MKKIDYMKKTNDIFEIDFLTNKDNYYLSDNRMLKYDDISEFDLKDVALYKIDEISFEEKSPRKEALENVLSTMKIDGVNFIYLILGDEHGVNFYYGVAKDYSYKENLEIDIDDVGKIILESGIKGNFRGSKTRVVNADDKKNIMENISNMKYYSMLDGVPGYTKEDEKFQGVDRLVDVMLGDKFGFMIIAKALSYAQIKDIENNLYNVYNTIAPLAKNSMQGGVSENIGTSKGITNSVSTNISESNSSTTQESNSKTFGTNNSSSQTEGENTSKSDGENSSESTSKGTNTSKSSSENKSSGSTTNSGGESRSNSSSKGRSTNETKGESKSETKSSGTSSSDSRTTGISDTKGTSTSSGTSESNSIQDSKGTGTSASITFDNVDKRAQDWIKYLDEIIIPRLDYGMGKGIFITSSFLFSENKAVLKKLENTSISLYSGEKGNKIPLKSIALDGNIRAKERKLFSNFQLPSGTFKNDIILKEEVARSALSQYIMNKKYFSLGNWITTNELAMIAGLPQKDVVGLELKEEVEFGLNFKEDMKDEDKINLGYLVQSGNILEHKIVSIDKKNLDKHIFITGVTGSGKTTTCQKILIDSDFPFLVIEPAKTEYRILSDRYDDIMIFTLGNDNIIPFRLNPFEFFRHESITSRVDMIKASIEAAFDMEAAMPQIIESTIYECYKDYGWNISNNKNEIYGNSAFDDGVYSFPTLSDLVSKIEFVVVQQGFDDRLKNDYIGSIKARLQGLIMGSKGMMLNTKRSIDFKELLNKRVVLELEEIRNGSEKSLVMGFILINLLEAIKSNFIEKGAIKHITLVEEAHRLLSKFSQGDSPNKKHGVEMFADMLAEIRKYGESLMIADQIPNKLTPEVLKNTNTKIVHKIFAEDDKEAIGNTIALAKEQKEFLSSLETGRAIVFTQGFNKALQIQIDNITNTTLDKQTDIEILKNNIYKYYAKNYKKGIIEGTQYLKNEPSIDNVKYLLDISKEDVILSGCTLYYLKKYGKFPDKIINDDIINFIRDNEIKHFIDFLLSSKENVHIIIDTFIHSLNGNFDKYGREFLREYFIIYLDSKRGISSNQKILLKKFAIIDNFFDDIENNEFKISELELKEFRNKINKVYDN